MRQMCKKPKIEQPENLAKVDLWVNRSLTPPRAKRITGSKNFRLSPQRDLCNNIRQ